MTPIEFSVLMAVLWVVAMIGHLIRGLMWHMDQMERDQEHREYMARENEKANLYDRCNKLVMKARIKSGADLRLWLNFRTPHERKLLKDLTDYLFIAFETMEEINSNDFLYLPRYRYGEN